MSIMKWASVLMSVMHAMRIYCWHCISWHHSTALRYCCCHVVQQSLLSLIQSWNSLPMIEVSCQHQLSSWYKVDSVRSYHVVLLCCWYNTTENNVVSLGDWVVGNQPERSEAGSQKIIFTWCSWATSKHWYWLKRSTMVRLLEVSPRRYA